jgi:hypothetical protein
LYKRSCETADVDEAANKAEVSFSHREVDHKRLSIQPSNRGESRLPGEREKLGRDLKNRMNNLPPKKYLLKIKSLKKLSPCESVNESKACRYGLVQPEPLSTVQWLVRTKRSSKDWDGKSGRFSGPSPGAVLFLENKPQRPAANINLKPHDQNIFNVISLQASPRTMLPPDSGFLSQWGGTG